MCLSTNLRNGLVGLSAWKGAAKSLSRSQYTVHQVQLRGSLPDSFMHKNRTRLSRHDMCVAPSSSSDPGDCDTRDTEEAVKEHYCQRQQHEQQNGMVLT